MGEPRPKRAGRSTGGARRRQPERGPHSADDCVRPARSKQALLATTDHNCPAALESSSIAIGPLAQDVSGGV